MLADDNVEYELAWLLSGQLTNDAPALRRNARNADETRSRTLSLYA